MSQSNGSFRLFRVAGIDVFLHWSWLLVAVIELSQRKGAYRAWGWNVVEYLTLFGVVLLHEFGHAFACRSVGGKAEQIILWPLGGLAVIDPPPRPGALLWSIAAGPLVNLVLLCFGIAALVIVGISGAAGDGAAFVSAFAVMNFGLLAFNLLPVYPLDGGQMLRALLWFFIGRARSLTVAGWIGAIVAGLALVASLLSASIWMAVMSFFAMTRAIGGIGEAQKLAAMSRAPRRPGARCPSCRAEPPLGAHWRCACGGGIDALADPFLEEAARCARCGRVVAEVVSCPDCGRPHPRDAWLPAQPAETVAGA